MRTGPRSISRSASVLVGIVLAAGVLAAACAAVECRRASIRSRASGFPLGTFSKELRPPRAGAHQARLGFRAGRSIQEEYTPSPSTATLSSVREVPLRYTVDGGRT